MFIIMVMLGRRDFFFVTASLLSVYPASLLAFFACFFILFHSCCSDARMYPCMQENTACNIAILNDSFFREEK